MSVNLKSLMSSGLPCVLIRKKNGILEFDEWNGYETRNESVIHLIKLTVACCDIADFEWILVITEDSDRSISERRILIDDHIFHEVKKRVIPIFNFSTSKSNYDFVCPDFVFDHWKQVGLVDYEETRKSLRHIGPPLTDCLGWRGSLTHPSRYILVNLNSYPQFDCEMTSWNRANPERLSANNYLTFEEQVLKWRYLIDVEGYGYSGRLKLLLSSPRVTFIQNRVHEEFFFPYLIPWEHYVPVKSDLSDLLEKLALVRNNINMETHIIHKAQQFSERYLSRKAALLRWAEILNSSQENRIMKGS